MTDLGDLKIPAAMRAVAGAIPALGRSGTAELLGRGGRT